MDLHMGPVHRWAPVSTVTISVRLQTELIIKVASIKLEREAKHKDQRNEAVILDVLKNKNTRPDGNWISEMGDTSCQSNLFQGPTSERSIRGQMIPSSER